MKILFVSTHLYPCKIGGVELFHYYLISAVGKDHIVWVITSCDIDFNEKNIHVIKMNPKKFGSQKLSTIYEHTRNILKIRNKIEVIHVPYMSRSWLYGCYLPILKKLCGLRYILSLHGGAMLPWTPKLPHKLLFQSADAIVAVSNTLKKEYERRSGREIDVIPPLLPFKKSEVPKYILKEKYGFRRGDKIILSLGSIKKIKGSDILLNAYFLLGEKFIEKNQIKLLYVGDGVMKKELEEKVKHANFEKHVKFFGNILHEKIPEMFKLADIYVIPSLFEAIPVSLEEAMFNGLSVIGTNTAGIANLISDGENGLLFERNNSESLMTKLKKLLSDDELILKIGKRAREDYEKSFNFENIVNDYLRIYDRVIKKR